jgi:signal transduction histidine kinase
MLEAALPEAEVKTETESPAKERLRAGADLDLAQQAEERDHSSQSAYDVVRMLNRGQGLRAERKRKVVEEPLSKVYAQTAAPEGGKDASFARSSDSASPSQPRPPSARRVRSGYSEAPMDLQLSEAAEGPAVASPGRLAIAPAEETHPAADELGRSDKKQNDRKKGKSDGRLEDEATVRVTLDPMVGRAGSPGQLLLYRTVVVGEQGYRQGLLLDWHQLGQWLQEEVLQSSGLAQLAHVSFFGPDGDSDAPPRPAGELEIDPATDRSRGDGYVFAHRFGEPFDALSVELALQPLPGVGSAMPVYLLAGLLALVAAAGLAAIYRMVAVVVQFAERRSNFVAAVSHELKTPLTSIRMYGEMLRDGLVASEAKRDDYYRTITDESERLSRLINNVLEFSRLERGKRELHLTRGSLAALLEEIAEQLRPHAEREGFRLELALDERLPSLRFDRDAVIQVLFNLVDNSIKYARDAEPKDIRLECRRLEDRVCLSLRDYGPGVPPRHLARVFEAFYRGEDELTRTTKGTGIGLALVKELVESMGASIRAANLDAAEGGGFAVYIEFPSAGTG